MQIDDVKVKKIYNELGDEYTNFEYEYIHKNDLQHLIKIFEAIYNGNHIKNAKHLYVFLKDYAHLLQNSGDNLFAYRLSNEILLSNNNDISFELSFYERLQDLYYKFNSKRLSKKALDIFGNKIKYAMTQGLKYEENFLIQYEIAVSRYFFIDHGITETIEKYEKLLEKNINQRLRNHILLSIIELQLIDFTNNIKTLQKNIEEIEKELTKIYQDSKKNTHYYNMNRSSYLQCILLILTERNITRIEEAINIGEEVVLKTNYDFFSLKYYNLKIALNIKFKYETFDGKTIQQHYLKLYYQMASKGFLFLGDADVLNFNILLVNNILKYSPISYENNDKKLCILSFNANNINNSLRQINHGFIGNNFNPNKIIKLNTKNETIYLDMLS